jgi:hypothetical protein
MIKRFDKYFESKAKKFFDNMPEYQKTDMIGDIIKARLNFNRRGYGVDTRYDEWEVICIKPDQTFYVYGRYTGLDLKITEEELFKAIKGQEAKAEMW